MRTTVIMEGSTRVIVPVLDLEAEFPPSSAEVFYNPRMELSRDIGVAAMAVLGGRSYVDALAATGIRGVRVANEVGGMECSINDWSPAAYELIKKNIELNGLRCEATRRNANVLLHERGFDVVDLDPFGSPAPFLDAAAASVRKTLCVTATDTAPLCGAHLNSGIRKYSSVPLKTEYHPEMAVRVLLGSVARHLALHDKSIVPVFSQAVSHFIRLYVQTKKGARGADRSMREMGYIAHCFSCGRRWWKHGLAIHIEERCSRCEGSSRLAGPLWLGPLHDPGFLQNLRAEVESRPLGTRDRAVRIISLAGEELQIPTYYDYHLISKDLGVAPPPIDSVIEALRELGYDASRTHFSGTSIKTDADVDVLREVMVGK